MWMSGMMMLPMLLLLCSIHTEAAIDADLVTSLPRITFQPTFKHYSGYLKATGTRHLHYWFAESSGNPSKDPVVLWLNGGPGCSSMDGMLSEHGPFRVSEDGKSINLNPHSWNKIANMLYIEAPACVGYSYTDDKNCTTDDDQVALDNHMALRYFFSNFPEYSGNEFYITGESYGGVYVPTLSARVVQDSSMNFKGSAIGNGLSAYDINSNSLIYFAYYHGFLGADLWSKLEKFCCACNTGGHHESCDFASNDDPDCQSALETASQLISQLNIYNAYAECYHGNQSISSLAGTGGLQSRFHPIYWLFPKVKPIKEAYKQLLSLPKKMVSEVPPCVDVRGMTDFMNDQEVRKALHIPTSLPTWEICNGRINYIRKYTDMKQVYLQLLATKKVRLTVYNGDADMACNFLGDEWFVDSLNQELVLAWKPWMYKAEDGSSQVAGFAKQYKNINFVTVKGAGHMVPSDKPIPAFVMFQKFLKNEPF